MSTETEERAHVTSHGGIHNSICLEGFTKEELEKVLGAMQVGNYYIRVQEGRLVAIPAYQELPGPAEDEEMMPFWRKHDGTPMQTTMFKEYQHSEEGGYSPSITIQHLCGYYYSKENYEFYAERLESYGFECLRSRRGNDGKFWEIWFLPSLNFSQGKLRERIGRGKDDKEKLRLALEFLRDAISFGTLDVSFQRMAMALDTEF